MKRLLIIGLVLMTLMTQVFAMTVDNQTFQSSDNTTSIYFDTITNVDSITIYNSSIYLENVSYTKNDITVFISTYNITGIVNTSIFPIPTIQDINTVLVYNVNQNTSGYITFDTPSYYLSSTALYYGNTLDSTRSFDPYPSTTLEVTYIMNYYNDTNNTLLLGYTTYDYQKTKEDSGDFFAGLSGILAIYFVASAAFIIITAISGSMEGVMTVVLIDIGVFILIILGWVIRGALLKLF